MKQFNTKKFFKRQSRNVKDNYLFSLDELRQKLATINLFEKFDTDGSGALDAEELKILFNENGVMVSEDDIKALFGDAKVKFTLEMFEQTLTDKFKLKIFRESLKKIKDRLLNESF